MQRYEERLAAYQAVDFDDLIGLPLKLLQRDAEVRAKWQDTLRHVLVDEYQDTNAVQYELLKPLVGERAHVHRGGRRRPEHLRLARRDHREPEAPAAGLSEAEGDPAGAELPLDRPHPARRQPGHRREPEDLREEAVERVRRRRAGARGRVRQRGARGRACGGSHPGAGAARAAGGVGDFAILYRANHQARVFEQALRAAQIPYKVSGGQSFFDRAEIKDLCAWLRLLVNNDDDPAFLRAVATPKRGIGHQTLASAGRIRGAGRRACSRRCSPSRSAPAVGSQARRLAARVRPLRERPRAPRASSDGSEDAQARCCSAG